MRFNLVLDEHIEERFVNHIPRGIRSEFCRIILDMALDAADEYGPGFVGLVMAGEISFIPSNRNGQNLAKAGKSHKDG